jgi:cytochrome c oxidase subunit 2
MIRRLSGVIAVLLALAGCYGGQSAWEVHGTSAISIKALMILVIAVCTSIWIMVVVMAALALHRRRVSALEAEARSDQRVAYVIGGAVVATVLVITMLTVASFYTTRSIDQSDTTEVAITVRGEQWWWRIIYTDPDPAKTFETANEIHVPVGKAVRLQLESADVIHSFWVPSLAGKQDLVPGRTNFLSIRAERPGVYRGQCAEFCGLQHSHMAMLIVADDQAGYEHWLSSQRSAALSPTMQEVSAGQGVFLQKPCAACHSIRGTSAKGSVGPDLTHVGSRATIAAGLLERTRGTLAAWVADPQTLKPGNYMPMVPLQSHELRQVSAYMESLK